MIIQDSPQLSPVIALLFGKSVSTRAKEVFEQALLHRIPGVTLDADVLEGLADKLADELQANYPDGQIPPHGIWRSLENGGIDRWDRLASSRGFESAEEMLRCAGDLAIIAALSELALPEAWTYCDGEDGKPQRGRDTLALTVSNMFVAGHFSANPADPFRVDAHALIRMEQEEVASAFQLASPADDELIARIAAHYKRLGETLALRPDLFEEDDDVRPGNLLVKIASHAKDGAVPAGMIMDTILDGLSPLWLGGAEEDGVVLGDCWRTREIAVEGDLGDLIPLQLPAVRTALSLVEPLAWAGIAVSDLDDIPGLADAAHVALMLGSGCLLVDETSDAPRLDPGDRSVVLRALSIEFASRLAALTRKKLRLSAAELPLTCLIEGGMIPLALKLDKDSAELFERVASLIGSEGVFWLSFGHSSQRS